MKGFFKKYLENKCSESEFLAFINMFLKAEKQKELGQSMQEHWKEMPLELEAPDLSPTLHKIHFEINNRERGGTQNNRFVTYLTQIAAVLFIPLAIAFFLNIRKEPLMEGTQTISTPLRIFNIISFVEPFKILIKIIKSSKKNIIRYFGQFLLIFVLYTIKQFFTQLTDTKKTRQLQLSGDLDYFTIIIYIKLRFLLFYKFF